MRRSVLILTLLAMTLAMTGCVTTGSGSMHQADSPSARQKAARIHTELGWHLMQQGRLEPAHEKLLTALDFDENYVQAHTVLGLLYTRLNLPNKAEKEYRRAVQLDPKDGNTNNNFGRFLCQHGKASEGIAYFKKALADPFYKNRAKTLTNTGSCQIKAGQYKQAESSLRRALKINSRYPDALYQMARAFYLQGDAFHASAYVQRYQSLGLTNPTILKLGYDIESRLGDAEGAQDYARQLRSKFPDSEQARALDTKRSP